MNISLFSYILQGKSNKLISQYDTVIGKIGDMQRLLTIHIPALHFQFRFLITNATSEEVNKVLLDLRKKIGIELWKKIFSIMLCDNGTEFHELYRQEFDEKENKLSNVFYCDPYCSSQKGACERNHELIRYIEQKHHSLNHLTQEKINLMFSHINSTPRESLGDKTPYEIFTFIYGKNLATKLNIQKIKKDEVCTTPRLLK